MTREAAVLYHSGMRLRAWLRRATAKADDATWSEHCRQLRAIFRFQRDIVRRGLPRENERGDVTAIILNYKRPQNVELIVRALLLTPSVKRVIVSNNDHKCDLSRWIECRHPKIEIIEKPTITSGIQRHVVARKSGEELFLMVDDDLFLSPEQYEIICQGMKADRSRPHGMFGECVRPDGSFEHALRGDQTVDVFNRVYACTRTQNERFWQLAALLESFGSDAYRRNTWQDLVLSFSGEHRPLLHEIGPYLDCPTQGNATVAAWRRQGFFDDRKVLYDQLLKIDGGKTHPLPSR